MLTCSVPVNNWLFRVALSKDQALQELATTPLMLSILMLTYQRVAVESFSVSSSFEIRKRVFSTYLQRMLQRRSVETRYTQEQLYGGWHG